MTARIGRRSPDWGVLVPAEPEVGPVSRVMYLAASDQVPWPAGSPVDELLVPGSTWAMWLEDEGTPHTAVRSMLGWEGALVTLARRHDDLVQGRTPIAPPGARIRAVVLGESGDIGVQRARDGEPGLDAELAEELLRADLLGRVGAYRPLPKWTAAQVRAGLLASLATTACILALLGLLTWFDAEAFNGSIVFFACFFGLTQGYQRAVNVRRQEHGLEPINTHRWGGGRWRQDQRQDP